MFQRFSHCELVKQKQTNIDWPLFALFSRLRSWMWASSSELLTAVAGQLIKLMINVNLFSYLINPGCVAPHTTEQIKHSEPANVLVYTFLHNNNHWISIMICCIVLLYKVYINLDNQSWTGCDWNAKLNMYFDTDLCRILNSLIFAFFPLSPAYCLVCKCRLG